MLSVKSGFPMSHTKVASLIRIARYTERLSWLYPDLCIQSTYVRCLQG